MTAAAPSLSIVIPTRNAATRLPACLAALVAGRDRFSAFEILVADCGSTDGTRAIASQAGARLIDAPMGRGRQLRAGCAAATGDWLLVVHADTVLEAGWPEAAAAFAADPDNRMRAGYGRLVYDDPSPWARLIEWVVIRRAHLLGLPYGDQALLLSRALYEDAGGYPDWPLMEDVALTDRIGRRRLVALDMAAETSADRYRKGGWIRRPLWNLVCLALYRLGVAPERIVTLYDR